MPNKRSEGGRRNRNLLGAELTTFLADLSDLAADLGMPSEGSGQPRSAETSALAPSSAAPPETASPAPPSELPSGDLEAQGGAREAVGGLDPPSVIEDLPHLSPSYLPPLPPDQELEALPGGPAAAPAVPAGAEVGPAPADHFPGPPALDGAEEPSPDPSGDRLEDGSAVSPLDVLDDQDQAEEARPVEGPGEADPAPPSPAPPIPGGLPVLVSRRPWSLAAAMAPLEPISPPPPPLPAQPQANPVASPRPAPPRQRRPGLRVHLPLLPTVILAMLGVVIVLLVLRLVTL